jgi:hypothetical protein
MIQRKWVIRMPADDEFKVVDRLVVFEIIEVIEPRDGRWVPGTKRKTFRRDRGGFRGVGADTLAWK